MDNTHILERFVRALEDRDIQASGELMHPDIVVRYPQSGETIRGRENYLKMLADYPEALPEGHVSSVTGEASTAVTSSPLPFVRPTVTVFGGDLFVVEGLVTYPDGGVFHTVVILRLQGGLVIEETSYFAAPFEAPAWRRPYVEP